jgi:hypothetical protein
MAGDHRWGDRMNGLTPEQAAVLARLAEKTEPTLPWHIGTTWRTLRGLKAKRLIEWRSVGQLDGVDVEGALITAKGRRRISA